MFASVPRANRPRLCKSAGPERPNRKALCDSPYKSAIQTTSTGSRNKTRTRCDSSHEQISNGSTRPTISMSRPASGRVCLLVAALSCLQLFGAPLPVAAKPNERGQSMGHASSVMSRSFGNELGPVDSKLHQASARRLQASDGDSLQAPATSGSASGSSQFQCPEQFGYYTDVRDCTRYYVCVFGEVIHESCTGGLRFSRELQTCDWPRNVDCPQIAQQQQQQQVNASSQASSMATTASLSAASTSGDSSSSSSSSDSDSTTPVGGQRLGSIENSQQNRALTTGSDPKELPASIRALADEQDDELGDSGAPEAPQNRQSSLNSNNMNSPDSHDQDSTTTTGSTGTPPTTQSGRSLPQKGPASMVFADEGADPQQPSFDEAISPIITPDGSIHLHDGPGGTFGLAPGNGAIWAPPANPHSSQAVFVKPLGAQQAAARASAAVAPPNNRRAPQGSRQQAPQLQQAPPHALLHQHDAAAASDALEGALAGDDNPNSDSLGAQADQSESDEASSSSGGDQASGAPQDPQDDSQDGYVPPVMAPNLAGGLPKLPTPQSRPQMIQSSPLISINNQPVEQRSGVQSFKPSLRHAQPLGNPGAAQQAAPRHLHQQQQNQQQFANSQNNRQSRTSNVQTNSNQLAPQFGPLTPTSGQPSRPLPVQFQQNLQGLQSVQSHPKLGPQIGNANGNVNNMNNNQLGTNQNNNNNNEVAQRTAPVQRPHQASQQQHLGDQTNIHLRSQLHNSNSNDHKPINIFNNQNQNLNLNLNQNANGNGNPNQNQNQNQNFMAIVPSMSSLDMTSDQPLHNQQQQPRRPRPPKRHQIPAGAQPGLAGVSSEAPAPQNLALGGQQQPLPRPRPQPVNLNANSGQHQRLADLSTPPSSLGAPTTGFFGPPGSPEGLEQVFPEHQAQPAGLRLVENPSGREQLAPKRPTGAPNNAPSLLKPATLPAAARTDAPTRLQHVAPHGHAHSQNERGHGGHVHASQNLPLKLQPSNLNQGVDSDAPISAPLDALAAGRGSIAAAPAISAGDSLEAGQPFGAIDYDFELLGDPTGSGAANTTDRRGRPKGGARGSPAPSSGASSGAQSTGASATPAVTTQASAPNKRPQNKRIQVNHELALANTRASTEPARRPESVFSRPQAMQAAQKCDARVCRLPDCKCGDSLVPGGLDSKQVPQIVLLTFDDAVNDLNWEIYEELFNGRVNPNGCPILATFYVSHEWTDYGQVQTLYSRGHEMASHSVTHSFGEKFSKSQWFKEINGQREILNMYGGVKMNDVRGMRAPFLQIGGNKMFEMLYDANFTYDSSMPIFENSPPLWPYTLDYQINHECMITPCPSKSYPGVWEVGMTMWLDLRGGRCSMGDACSNPPDEDGVHEMLMKNFNRHYKSNRAPFGLFYHSAWFNTVHHRRGFLKFLTQVNAMQDVYFVTNWQMIQWMRQPTGLADIAQFEPWQCNAAKSERPPPCFHPSVCNVKSEHGTRFMKTCQPCPANQQYPWVGATGFKAKQAASGNG